MTTAVDQGAPPRRFTRGRVAVVLLLLLAGVAAWWWMTHPRAFMEVGSAMMGPVPAETRAYLGMEIIPEDGMELHGATPRVVFNLGDVETGVAVCHPAGRRGVGFVHAEEIDSLCESLTAPVGPVQRGDFLVVEVIGYDSGLVALNGVDVTYSTGMQRGTQAVGLEAAIIVEDAAGAPPSR